MHIGYCILLLLFSFTVNGQNLDRLDAINGFRQFKFGMSSNQIQNIITKKSTVKPRGVVYYSYVGKDIPQFNGVAIESITLGFYKNQLFGIQVAFGNPYKDYTKAEFEMVQQGLESNFGNDFHKCDDNDPNEIDCFIFDGVKVRLESVRFNLSESDGSRKKEFKYLEGYMLFSDKNLALEQRKSEVEQ